MNSKLVFAAVTGVLGLISCGSEAYAATREAIVAPEFGDVVIEGEGCADRLKVETTTGKPVSIAFPGEGLSVGNGRSGNDATRVQLRCRVVFPLNIPDGMRVRTQAGTWQGTSHFSEGSLSTATVQARLFFDGEFDSVSASAALPKANVPLATTDSPWSLALDGLASSAPCGQSARLSIQLTLVLRQGDANGDEARLQPGPLELPAFLYQRCATAK